MDGMSQKEILAIVEQYTLTHARPMTEQVLMTKTERAIKRHLLASGAVLFEPAHWWPTCKRVMRDRGYA